MWLAAVALLVHCEAESRVNDISMRPSSAALQTFSIETQRTHHAHSCMALVLSILRSCQCHCLLCLYSCKCIIRCCFKIQRCKHNQTSEAYMSQDHCRTCVQADCSVYAHVLIGWLLSCSCEGLELFWPYGCKCGMTCCLSVKCKQFRTSDAQSDLLAMHAQVLIGELL